MSADVEIKLIHKNETSSINCHPTTTIKELKEFIKDNFGYSKLNQFEIYFGKYLLGEVFNHVQLQVLFKSFAEINTLEIIPSSENFYQADKKNNPLTLTDYMDKHEKVVESYFNSYHNEICIKDSFEQLEMLRLNLSNMYNEISKNQEELRKRGIFDQFKENLRQKELFTKERESKKINYEKCIKQVLELKNLEKIAVEIINENKKLVGKLHWGTLEIDGKQKGLGELMNKQNALIKKREGEAKLIENYITSKNKFTVFEYVKLRFVRIYKHLVIMKLLNENYILAYKPTQSVEKSLVYTATMSKNAEDQPNFGKPEPKKINDLGGFKAMYTIQEKRDEFFLNFKEKLLITIKTAVFLFDYKTCIMSRIQDLNEDHKGAGLIFVPAANAIYVVSGLLTLKSERLKLDKHLEISPTKAWEATAELHKTRGYYTSFVQNDSKLFIFFGYSAIENEFLTDVEYLNTCEVHSQFKRLLLNKSGGKVPKLLFGGSVAGSDYEVHIIGGKDVHNNDNPVIYLLDLKNESIEDSNMRLPLPYESIHMEGNANNQNLIMSNTVNNMLFYQETGFIAVRPGSNNFDNCFLVGMFDSKNSLHMINLKNFEYTWIPYEDEPFEQLDGEEGNEEDFKNSSDR